MLAVPIDSLGENPLVSDYFGKSKWFAIIEDETISFEKNTKRKGCLIAKWLYDLGVTKTIVNHIGINPLLKLNELEIECLYSKGEIATLVEVFDKLEKKELLIADQYNMKQIIDIEKGCNEICD